MPRLGRALAGLLGGVLLGVVLGTATVLVHSSWWWLLLGVATALSALRWLPTAPRVGFALGWALAVARASLVRPEGDYLVSADGQGWTLIVSSLVLVAATLVGAALSGARAGHAGGQAGDHGVRGTPS